MNYTENNLVKFWTEPEGIGRPMFQLRYETYDNAMTPERAIKDDAADLADQLRRNQQIASNQNDFVGRLFPYVGTTAFASAFGAKTIYVNSEHPISEPCIHSAEDALRMKPAELEAGDLKRALEKTEYFLGKTKGEYPISVMDMQGPFDTAALLWDKEDFLMALYDEPEAVHHVMDLVTDNFIAFGQKMKQMIPDFVPMHTPNLWAPSDYGMSVSEDSIVMINAQMFDEYVFPYLERISRAFNGLTLHSCGNWKQHMRSIKKIPGLKAINFGAGEMPMTDIAQVFDTDDCDVKITMHTGLNSPITYHSNIHFIEDGLKTFRHHNRLFFLCWDGSYNPYHPMEDLTYRELADYLSSRGITF